MTNPAASIRTAVFALLLATVPAAALDSVPTFDVRPSCRAATDSGASISKDIDSCVRTEHNARDVLRKDWTQYAAADRSTCAQTATMAGPPTYTQLLTCLEMTRDVKKIPREKGADTRIGR